MRDRAILLVTSCVPYPSMGGHFIRAWGLVRALSAIADVDLIVLYRPSHQSLVSESGRAVSNLCKSAEYIPLWDSSRGNGWESILFGLPKVRVPAAYLWPRSDIRSAVQRRLDRGTPQIVWLDLHPAIHYVRLVARWRVRKVMGTYDAEPVRLREVASSTGGLRRLRALMMAFLENLLEHIWARAYEVIVTVSEQDADFYRGVAPHAKVVVVPSFVDLSRYEQPVSSPGRPDIAMVGSMSAPFNAESALWFVRRILPRVWARRADVRLFLVGHDPPAEIQALASDRIVVTGTVPDAMQYLRRCCALVVPLQHGEGTRLKIIEAMASGVPVVSTTVGCEGLEVVHERDILIADEPDSFAEMVLRLLQSPGDRAHISANALDTVRDKYSLEVNRRLLEQVLYG